VAEPILDSARIVARIGQSEAAGVAEHVAMHVVLKARPLTDALYEPIDRVRSERSAALGRKDEAAVGELPPQLPQCPDFVAPERVNARFTVLGALDMQRCPWLNSTATIPGRRTRSPEAHAGRR
jgi:hypothetical protein